MRLPGLPATWFIWEGLRRLVRPFRAMDDFDWRRYHLHYRAEYAESNLLHTHDLAEAGARLENGRLVLPPGARPAHPNHACLWEVIARLPCVRSVAEFGVGGGYLLAGVGHLLPDVRLSGYDISPEQLRVFAELLPAAYARVRPQLLDVTVSPIPAAERPDLVYAHTVLMHIQRPNAYRRGLANLITSARRYALIIDNWTRHDYAEDVPRAARDAGANVYVYDSGRQVAMVVAREPLDAPFVPLTDDPAALTRYR